MSIDYFVTLFQPSGSFFLLAIETISAEKIKLSSVVQNGLVMCIFLKKKLCPLPDLTITSRLLNIANLQRTFTVSTIWKGLYHQRCSHLDRP
jgi:hypothetical protein